MANRVMAPVGHNITPRSTPVHILELLLVLLRVAFSEMGGANFPFRYSKNSAESKIFIDTPYNLVTNQTGGRPGVIVARGPANLSQQMVNHKAAQSMQTMSQAKTTLADAGFEFRIISRKPEEADILANEVLNVLLTCSEMLPKMTSIHKIQGFSLGVVGKLEQDETMYACSILMSCLVRYLWVDIPEQNILNSIQLTLNERTLLIE